MNAADRELFYVAERIGRRLLRGGQSVTTAESCTGGWIAKALTDVAGSSEWFGEGFVTYSNEAKVRTLGVARALLKREGAVSEAVARAMAAGALERTGATVAVAVTGIAGPGGAVPGKPVGTVVGFAGRRSTVRGCACGWSASDSAATARRCDAVPDAGRWRGS